MGKKEIRKIVFIFILFLVLAAYMEANQGELTADGSIERNDTGNGEKHLTLELEAEELGLFHEYQLEVEEVLLTEEEANELMEKAIHEIEEDFADIKDVIPISKSFEDGLVEATWKFDESQCMDMEGNVIKEEIPQGGLVVNAEVCLECQNYQMTYCFAFVIPEQEVTEPESLLSAIDAYMESEQKKEGETEVTLPKEINGISLNWKEKEEYLVLKILCLELLVVVLLLLSKAEKKKEEERTRREYLEMDYPNIVGQMTILLGSGMTISMAWNIIATRYLEKRKRLIIEERPAYEEMVLVNRHLREGENERDALMLWGNRIPLMEYRRLIRILLNNKSKGGMGLCQELEQEVNQAYEQRILRAKKKGEEMSTKMLIPLMLMMVLVMAIVIMPAIMEFAG